MSEAVDPVETLVLQYLSKRFSEAGLVFTPAPIAKAQIAYERHIYLRRSGDHIYGSLATELAEIQHV